MFTSFASIGKVPEQRKHGLVSPVYKICPACSAGPSAINPERRCSSRYRFRTAGTQNTCPAAAPLAAGSYVMFKLATLVYTSLAGTVPAYLSNECHLTSSVGVPDMCTSSHTHNSYGVCCLATAGPSLSNSLPLQVREPDISDISFNCFKLYWRRFKVSKYQSIAEQPSSWTAIDWHFDHFSP